MKRAAVICEFNPFHNGHKFLLEKIKEQFADEIVCIMSGNFVQRGDLAITDKYARTEAALKNGADLVAELPTVWAMASAPIFAQAGVRLAAALGCELLCFGAEDPLERLIAAVDEIDSDPVQQRIASLMKTGCSYPRAVSEAAGGACADVLSKANNTLAIEYIRACRRYGITPIAVPRTGAAHDSRTIAGNIASATLIRSMILSGKDCSALTPMTIEAPADIARIESAVLYRLKTMTVDEIARLPDTAEGLENRIAACAKENNSILEILSALKTKRYTMARLRRILLSAVLGITGEMQAASPPYLRILGVRADKKNLLHTQHLPLIIDVRYGYDHLNISDKEIFDVDLRAGFLMDIAAGAANNEFSRGVIVL